MLESGSEGHPSQCFLLSGGPNCHAHPFLGVIGRALGLECVVLGTYNGDWANQREKDRSLHWATELLPHGIPNPYGAAWEGRAPVNVSVNK